MIAVLFLTLSSILQVTVGKEGVCSKEGSEIKCCSDYIWNGEECTPCYGHFGPQCIFPCKTRHCGFGCRDDYLCEQCDRFNCSCLNNTAETTVENNFIQSMIVITVVVIGICLITTTMLAGYLLRCLISRNKMKDKDHHQPSNTMEPNIPLHDLERAHDLKGATDNHSQRIDLPEKPQNNTYGQRLTSMMYTTDDPLFEYDLSKHIRY